MTKSPSGHHRPGRDPKRNQESSPLARRPQPDGGWSPWRVEQAVGWRFRSSMLLAAASSFRVRDDFGEFGLRDWRRSAVAADSRTIPFRCSTVDVKTAPRRLFDEPIGRTSAFRKSARRDRYARLQQLLIVTSGGASGQTSNWRCGLELGRKPSINSRPGLTCSKSRGTTPTTLLSAVAEVNFRSPARADHAPNCLPFRGILRSSADAARRPNNSLGRCPT